MRIPSIQLKAAALVPMPSVRQRIARIENPGLRKSIRMPKRRSCKNSVCPLPYPLFARYLFGLLDSAELSQGRIPCIMGDIPAAMLRSVKRSRCACISSAISASRRFLENSPSSRENQARSRGINDSGSGKDEIDSLGNAQPVVLFRCKLFASGRGQFVITGFTIVIRQAPFCRDPS